MRSPSSASVLPRVFQASENRELRERGFDLGQPAAQLLEAALDALRPHAGLRQRAERPRPRHLAIIEVADAMHGVAWLDQAGAEPAAQPLRRDAQDAADLGR